MIVDSSAVLAILFGEPDARRHASAIMAASPCRMSVANLLEASVLAESRGGGAAADEFDTLLKTAGVEMVPVTREQVEEARRAWRRFGKSNHPAGLNFGDCFAYALAKTLDEPLLFKGEDFARTDIDAA